MHKSLKQQKKKKNLKVSWQLEIKYLLINKNDKQMGVNVLLNSRCSESGALYKCFKC